MEWFEKYYNPEAMYKIGDKVAFRDGDGSEHSGVVIEYKEDDSYRIILPPTKQDRSIGFCIRDDSAIVGLDDDLNNTNLYLTAVFDMRLQRNLKKYNEMIDEAKKDAERAVEDEKRHRKWLKDNHEKVENILESDKTPEYQLGDKIEYWSLKPSGYHVNAPTKREGYVIGVDISYDETSAYKDINGSYIKLPTYSYKVYGMPGEDFMSGELTEVNEVHLSRLDGKKAEIDKDKYFDYESYERVESKYRNEVARLKDDLFAAGYGDEFGLISKSIENEDLAARKANYERQVEAAQRVVDEKGLSNGVEHMSDLEV